MTPLFNPFEHKANKQKNKLLKQQFFRFSYKPPISTDEVAFKIFMFQICLLFKGRKKKKSGPENKKIVLFQKLT